MVVISVLEPEVIDYIADDSTVWEQEPLEKLVYIEQLSAYKHDVFLAAHGYFKIKLLEELWKSGMPLEGVVKTDRRGINSVSVIIHVWLCILGGGIIGLSTGMAWQCYPNARIVVLEKERFSISPNGNIWRHSLWHLLQAGEFHKFCREGSRSMVEFCQKHGIDEVCGKVIAATDKRTIALENLYKRGLENGWVLPNLVQRKSRKLNLMCAV